MMSRAEVTELVVTRRLEKKLSWAAIAEACLLYTSPSPRD